MRPKAPADLWEQMARVRHEVFQAPEKEDKDAFSATQYAERFRVGLSTACSQIRKLVRQGKVEMVYIKGRSPHYRLKE